MRRYGAHAGHVPSRAMNDAGVQRLIEHARSPTWTRIAGYSIEKVHTGVLVHALRRGGAASHALAVAMWNLATDEAITPAEVAAVEAAPECQLGTGRHSVIDLLVVITLRAGGRLRLGIEVKVDASPDWAQAHRLGSALRSIAAREPGRAAMVLLTLGVAQVCRWEGASEQSPSSVRRWGLDDLLRLREFIRAASDLDAVVEPWLRELDDEQLRRHHAREVAAQDAEVLGYRGRTLLTYQLHQLAGDLEAACHGSWTVSVQSHNVVATSHKANDPIVIDGAPLRMYLEIAGDQLCLKAWSSQGDARARARVAVAHYEAALLPPAVRLPPPVRRAGDSATLSRCRVDVQNPAATQLVVAAAMVAWDRMRAAHG